MKRIAALLMLFVTSVAHAASGRQVIEIHAVVNCDSNSGSIRFALPEPYGGTGCAGGDPIIEGADVIRVQHRKDPRIGEDVLRVTLSVKGRQLLFRYTLSHVKDQIVIIIDGRTVSAPVILQPLAGPTLEISGIPATEIDALVRRFQPPI